MPRLNEIKEKSDDQMHVNPLHDYAHVRDCVMELHVLLCNLKAVLTRPYFIAYESHQKRYGTL